MQRLGCLLAVLSVAVWSGLSTIVYDATCMNHAPRRFTQEERQELCAEHPHTLGPVACAHAMMRGNDNKKTVIRLCRNAYSTAAVPCFRVASAYSTLDTRIALCSRSNTTYPATCWKAVSGMPHVKPAQRLRICQAVQTPEELECVEAALRAFPNTDAWLECVEPGVRGLQQGVGRCILTAAELRLTMSPSQSVSSCRAAAESHLCLQRLQHEQRRWKLDPDLCFGATDGEPVSCAVQASALQPRIPSSVVGTLCRTARPTTAGSIHAALECFQRLPKTLPKELRADLCAGARSVAPADCFRAANMFADVQARVRFCQDAPDSNRLHCLSSCTRLVSGSGSNSNSSSNSAKLERCAFFCNDDAAADRTACLATISRISFLSDESKDFHPGFLELCKTAGDTTAVAAMVRCIEDTRRSLGFADALELCRRAQQPSHAADCLQPLLARMAPSAAAGICQLSRSEDHTQQIQHCLRQAPAAFQANLVWLQQLCTHPAPAESLKCVDELRFGTDLPAADVARVCGQSTRPTSTASCLVALADLPLVTIDAGLAETACADSKDLVMQKCLETVGVHVLTINELQECRNATREIVAFQVIEYHLSEEQQDEEVNTSAGTRGNAPVEGEAVSITLQAVDQWGLPILELDAQIFISVSLGPESSGVLEGTTRNRTNAAGQVVFPFLRIRGAGVHILHFKHNKRILHSTRILVLPASRSTEPLLGLCPRIFSSLVSVDEEAQMWNLRSFLPPPYNGLSFGVLPPKDVLWAVACGDVYAVWGVQLASAQHSIVLAGYREGVASLVTDQGVPGASDDPLAVLHLHQNFTRQELRRAYMKQSQQWHPDKWMDLPAFLQSATEAFQAVAAAYEKLSSSLSSREDVGPAASPSQRR